MRNDFNKDTEIAYIERFNKKLGRNEIKEFPLVGGRLRLMHEDLSAKENTPGDGIVSKIHLYDGKTAVVITTVTINGNSFSGTGMASESRDKLIFPAILELAETRSIARALRFAGYGVEYTGLEEVNHLAMAAESAMTIERPDTCIDSPEEKPETKNNPTGKKSGKSPKRVVWETLKDTWPEVSDETLAAQFKIFMANTLKRCEPNTPESTVYQMVIDYPDEFIRTFNAMLNPKKKNEKPIQPEPDAEPVNDMSEEIDSAKQELSKKLNVSHDSKQVAEARKKKAEILMSLPDGVNVKALNETIKFLVESNKDTPESGVMDIILGDLEGFIAVMDQYCRSSGIESGIDPRLLPGDDSDQDDKADGSKEYSEFRKSWVNLPFKKFSTFLIENADAFQLDRDEYDAAVEKFDRLKAKNGQDDVKFPFMFVGDVDNEPSQKIEAKQSVLKTDYDILQDLRSKYPKMCKRTEESCGIPQDCQNPRSVETFIDHFEHLISSWEAKNGGKKYVE